MRIALVSTPFVSTPPKQYGGTELVVHALAEGLVQRGHDVLVYATGDSVTSARLRSLYARAQWPPDFMIDLNHGSWAVHRAVDDGVDLIHAHTAAALAMARLVPEIPMVYTLHHERTEPLSAFYRHFPDAGYVAISADQARREVALPRMVVIHHGLDPSRFEWTRAPDDYVCFIGRFARVKGPHTAIDIAGRAGVPIRVAGEVHEVDRRFAESELLPRLARPNVHYLGCIGTRVKVPLLRDARALLAPIEWNEPFGLVLIEAMLSGCPVVAFPRGSVPELIEPGVTGFVAHSPEAMAELIRPGGAVDRFDRQRCRERAAHRFSRDRMVGEYERFYARTAREHGRQRPRARPATAPVADEAASLTLTG